jgi:hypothetical protein
VKDKKEQTINNTYHTLLVQGSLYDNTHSTAARRSLLYVEPELGGAHLAIQVLGTQKIKFQNFLFCLYKEKAHFFLVLTLEEVECFEKLSLLLLL